MSPSPHVADVGRADFEERVLAKSHEVPVVADFWAEWCAPCRTLKPMLEKLAAEYQGKFFLAKINTDAEKELAATYGIRSLPTVKVFRDGVEIDAFMGALPESAVRAVLERHVPRASDALLAAAREQLARGHSPAALATLHEAVASDPGSDRARLELARLLLAATELSADALAEGQATVAALSPETRNGPQADALRARLELHRLCADAPSRAELERRASAGRLDTAAEYQLGLRRVLAGDVEAGMQDLLEVVTRDRKFGDGAARKALVATFEMLGASDERVKKYRALLSRALY